MFVVIGRLQVRNSEEATRRLQAGMGALLKGCSGFQSYQSIDCGEGQRIGIITFDSAEDAEATRSKVEAWFDKEMSGISDRPELVGGEVLFTVRPDGMSAQPGMSSGAEARPH